MEGKKMKEHQGRKEGFEASMEVAKEDEGRKEGG